MQPTGSIRPYSIPLLCYYYIVMYITGALWRHLAYRHGEPFYGLPVKVGQARRWSYFCDVTARVERHIYERLAKTLILTGVRLYGQP